MNAPKLAPPRPKVDLDATVARLERVGMTHAAATLAERLNDASKEDLAPHLFLDRLLTDELAQRDERRVRTGLRISSLPTGQTLASFDFAFQPSIERSRIETLGTCAWIRARETLLIQGPPGVGKTIWLWLWASRQSRTASR
jgi:DNA replication protein DnaC